MPLSERPDHPSPETLSCLSPATQGVYCIVLHFALAGSQLGFPVLIKIPPDFLPSVWLPQLTDFFVFLFLLLPAGRQGHRPVLCFFSPLAHLAHLCSVLTPT
jgi:hypothetical protein